MAGTKIVTCRLSQDLSQLYGKSQETFYQIVVSGSEADVLFTLLVL